MLEFQFPYNGSHILRKCYTSVISTHLIVLSLEIMLLQLSFKCHDPNALLLCIIVLSCSSTYMLTRSPDFRWSAKYKIC